MAVSGAPAVARTAALTVRGRAIPVVLPRTDDPRLRLAAVLLTVQVLGQTVLGFKLSIAQILVTIAVSGSVEAAVTFRRTGALVWPASAMLTGNSVALLLRANGTEHGDWWSLNGIEYFVAAALLSLASKYWIRPGGRHVFNPSNVGLVWVLLVVGPTEVFPQYLYWGPPGLPVGLTVAVIVLGAGWVLRPLGMVPMAASFLVTFGALVGGLAVRGNAFFAIWHPEPVAGAFYWVNLVLSPEVLIFVFFMMSDPQTSPRTSRGRVAFGLLTAVVAAVLVAYQPTEFGAKLAILASLTVTCPLTRMLDGPVARALPLRRVRVRHLRHVAAAAREPAVVAVLIVALAAPVNTTRLADDEQLILMERGLTADPSPQ